MLLDNLPKIRRAKVRINGETIKSNFGPKQDLWIKNFNISDRSSRTVIFGRNIRNTKIINYIDINAADLLR
jgi:hypothetical protein